MTARQHSKIVLHFDRMTEFYGVKQAEQIHRDLLIGKVTPELRAQVRLFVAKAPQPKARMN